MLSLLGSEALTPARLAKVLGQRAIRERNPEVRSLSAQFLHLVDLEEPLSNDERGKLEALLRYGPTHRLGRRRADARVRRARRRAALRDDLAVVVEGDGHPPRVRPASRAPHRARHRVDRARAHRGRAGAPLGDLRSHDGDGHRRGERGREALRAEAAAADEVDQRDRASIERREPTRWASRSRRTRSTTSRRRSASSGAIRTTSS